MKSLLAATVAFGLGVASANAALQTVTIPDVGQFIGSGDAAVTFDGVTFSQSSALSNGNFFVVDTTFSFAPAPVVSSQEQTVGVPNILISLPTSANFLSLNYGTFDGSNVTFTLSNGVITTQSSSGDGYNTVDFYRASGVGAFTSVLLTETDINDVLSVNNITYGTVPEPSTWAMMMLGFAGMGYVGYRSRKVVSVAAS